MVDFHNSWNELLKDEFEKEYYQRLRAFLSSEYANHTVYPPKENIFAALKTVPREDTKVVILGQDPYHEEGQAHGMAFSVLPGVKQPPSLVNIFKELKDELEIPLPPQNNGYLMPWAKQGVLLLNTCLTVRAHQANSHRGKGWEIFTDRVISILSERREPMVFILWGANARSKKALIDTDRHLVLEGAHPSPLSAYNGFFGGQYFVRANEFLAANGVSPIDWDICK
ncbi:MAG: uracil-DNA glycosylase [Eubacterium sp.]|jgi:uracil-DNA glycosylase